MQELADDWLVNVIISPQPTEYGGVSIQVKAWGKSQEFALEGTKLITKLLADGKKTFMRVSPEVNSEKEFDTQQMIHRGYARFTVWDEKGEWIYHEKGSETFIGLAQVKEGK